MGAKRQHHMRETFLRSKTCAASTTQNGNILLVYRSVNGTPDSEQTLNIVQKFR